MMPDPSIFGAGVAGGGLGALITNLFQQWLRRDKDKVMHGKIDETKERVSDLELHVARNHPTKDDLKAAISPIEKGIELLGSKIDRISEKLDKKADK